MNEFQDALQEQNPEYVSYIKALIRAAKNYEESSRRPSRLKASDYYDAIEPRLGKADDPVQTTQITYEELVAGKSDGDNRASVVSSDVRDVVLAVLPSLIRIFASSEHVVEFIPYRAEDVDLAKDGTDYVSHVFWEQNDGFVILHSVFKDAMTVREGIAKWWTEEKPEKITKTFSDIPPEVLDNIVAEIPGAEVISADMSPNGYVKEAVVRAILREPRLRVAAVPPDEFRISADARDIESASLVGHERLARIAEVVALGYPRELVEEYATYEDRYDDRRTLDFAVGGGAGRVFVKYGEYTVLADPEDTGVEELRHIVTLGDNFDIVDDKPASSRRFAIFSCDPRQHEVIGNSLADLAMDSQRVHTNLMRGILDSLTVAINPACIANYNALMDAKEVLNDDIGKVIFTKTPPDQALAYEQTPFIGPAALQVLDASYMALARRTGLSDASKGLDPKALQSSTAVGVDAVITGAQERIELIARNLAETGLKTLFKGILEEAVSHPHPRCQAYIRGEFKTFDPSMFDVGMRVRVNPTMGKGADYTRLQALLMIKQDQMALIQQYGPKTGIVGPNEVLNTIKDILELANIKNTDRYFQYLTPEMWQQIVSAPETPDAAAILAQAQLEKVKSNVVIETAKLDASAENAQRVDDFNRDKLMVDGFLKLLELHVEQKMVELTRLNTKEVENAR